MSGLSRWAGVVLAILSTVAGAQADQLKKARGLADKNKFAPALKLVDKATAEAGNDLETTLELLELTGVCNAALKKAGPAKVAFQKLLSLAPNFSLNRKGPAPVLKAFADAKATAAPLAILPATPDMSTGRISEIAVEVQADPQKLAKTILFSYRADGGKWKARSVTSALGRVAGKVDATRKVEWYATVLGPNDAQVMRIRTVDSPITHTYAEPSSAAAAATPAIAPRNDPPPSDPPRGSDAPRRADADPPSPQLTPTQTEAPLEVVETGRGRAKWVAPISIAFLAAGAAAGGVGTFFAFQSGGARREFAEKTADPLVPRAVITRQGALELDSRARSGALLANSLWAAGGALVLAGVAVAIFGPDEAAKQ